MHESNCKATHPTFADKFAYILNKTKQKTKRLCDRWRNIFGKERERAGKRDRERTE